MPELRYNFITGEWVIIATERSRRPEDFAPPTAKPRPEAYVASCPFCPGNEGQTPPEVFRISRQGLGSANPSGPAKKWVPKADWQVRVVPNKYPALDAQAELLRKTEGLKRCVSGTGIHEVIIETPEHDRTLALLTEREIELVVETYYQRYEAITADPRVAHAVLFRNHGERAGTSLEHPHSQIVGTPIMPPQVRGRMENALRYFDETGECLYCSVMAQELLDQERIIAQSESFVAFVPYAALSPFHIWIFPLRHTPSFIEAKPEELTEFARILRLVLRKIYFGLGDPDYNFTLRTPPREASGMKYFHWYAGIIPRVMRVAGFELGSGMFINTALPEESAKFLRHVPVDPPQ